MNRRPLLRTLAVGGTLLSTGCAGSTPLTTDRLASSDVFEDHRFDGTNLVVEFRDGVDVREATLYDSATETTYETVERPAGSVRFPVVFPDRLETYVSRSLGVRAETSAGRAREWVPGVVHGAVGDVEPLEDGRARFDVENQATAPLLVRFVAIYDDVPNPTVDPQSDSFDLSSFDRGPGVVGIGSNRTFDASRTDLVVSPGETAAFETTYAPFAFPHGADAADCAGEERTGTVAVVHGSGGSAAYTFGYRLDGEPTAVEGRAADAVDGTTAGVCGGRTDGR